MTDVNEFLSWILPNAQDPNDPQSRVTQDGEVLEYSEPLTGVKALKEKLKHLRGRHDQKLHGNRGATRGTGRTEGGGRIVSTADAVAGGYAESAYAAGHSGPLLDRTAHDEAFKRIKAGFTKGGTRTWTDGRRKFLWDYIEWASGGKKTAAPDPKKYGDDVPRAATHLRRLSELDPAIKALGVKAPKPGSKPAEFTKAPGRPKPAPKPDPTPEPPAAVAAVVKPTEHFDDATKATILSEVYTGSVYKRGWRMRSPARRFGEAYIDWVSKGKEGPEPTPSAWAGTPGIMKAIKTGIEKHPAVAAALGIAPPKAVKPRKPRAPKAPTPYSKGETWDSGITSYDPKSRRRSIILADHNRALESLAITNGFDKEFAKEINAQIESTVADIFSKAEIRIGINHANVLSVLNEGRYKSQFETKTSEGSIDSAHSSRRDGEDKGMGIPPTGFPPRDRPIYGYAKGKDIVDSTGYGDGIAIVWKNEVKSRTTWTWGDSLGPMRYGETFVAPTLAPSTSAFGDDGFRTLRNKTESKLPYGSRGDKTAFLKAVDAATRETMASAYSYVEVQIHGGGDISGIGKIVAKRSPDGRSASSYRSSEYTRSLTDIEAKCKELGILFEYES